VCEPSLRRQSRSFLSPAEATAATTEAANTQSGTATRTETGVLNTTAGLSSSVRDFVPLLNFTGVISGVTKDDDTGVLNVDFNLAAFSEDRNVQFRAVIDTSPTLFEAIVNALPEDKRDERTEALLKDAADLDNVTLEVSYNVTGRRFGRAFQQYRNRFESLFRQVLAEHQDQDRDVNLDFFSIFRDFPAINFTDATFGQMGPARTTIESRVREIIEKEVALQKSIETMLQERRLGLFGQLVNNQPQLNFTISKALRDELFGPEGVSGRIAYEMGFANINGLDKQSQHVCDIADQLSATRDELTRCLDAYTSYVRAREGDIETGSRLSFFAEFTSVDDYSFQLPDDGVDLNIAGGTKWSAGLDYGRLLGVQADGTASARIDIAAAFESPANEDLGNKRFIVGLTITKNFGDISLPFGIVYANKGEFLTDVDRQLSAQIGLKFNLFSGLDKASQ